MNFHFQQNYVFWWPKVKDKFQLTYISKTSAHSIWMSKSVKDLDNTRPESFFLTQEALNKTKNFTSLPSQRFQLYLMEFVSWQSWRKVS